jgi:hypothetical protein
MDTAKRDFEGFNRVTMKTDEGGFRYFLTKGPVRLKGLYIITNGGFTAPVSPSLVLKKVKYVTQEYGLDPIFNTILKIDHFKIDVICPISQEDNFLRLDVSSVTNNPEDSTGVDTNRLYEITLTDLDAIIVEYYHPKELEMLIDSYIP